MNTVFNFSLYQLYCWQQLFAKLPQKESGRLSIQKIKNIINSLITGRGPRVHRCDY